MAVGGCDVTKLIDLQQYQLCHSKASITPTKLVLRETRGYFNDYRLLHMECILSNLKSFPPLFTVKDTSLSSSAITTACCNEVTYR